MQTPGASIVALQGWRSRAGLFGLFFLLNLVLAWPTLRWPMVYDDLHVIRYFDRGEILGALHGTWDPDRVETDGYRPFTTLFNAARQLAFGENVVAHRLFVLVLHGLYLALLVSLAARVSGTSPRAAITGGLLVLFSHLSVFHYVWLADGVHILQGLAFVGAGHLLLGGLASGRRLPMVLSGVVVMAGALVREDTLVVIPILVLLGLLGNEGERSRRRTRRLIRYGLTVGGAALVLMAVRKVLLPSAPAAQLCFGGVLHRLLRLLNPLGYESFDAASLVFSLGGWVIAGALVLALALLRREAQWKVPAAWLLCAVVACSAATEFQRDNLLFFPLAFLSLAVATALDEAALLVPGGAPLALACAAWLVLGGAYTSRLLAENFAPGSTLAISWNGQFIYGWARKARMPEARRAELVRRMAAFGIHSRHQLRRRLEVLERECVQAGLRHPTREGRAFYPLAAFPPNEF